MEILYIVQIFFYLTVSFAIIFASVMVGMVCYKILSTVKRAKEIIGNIEDASNNLIGRVNGIIDTFSLPAIISFIKSKTGGRKKGKKVDNEKNNKSE